MDQAPTPSSTAQAQDQDQPVREGLPPGPRFAPLQTYRYVTRPFEYMAGLRARYGDVVLIPVLNGNVVMGFTPQAAKDAFSADPDVYDPFAVGALAPILGEGSLLVITGDEHKRGRKLLTPPFHGARMRAYGASMQEVTNDACARWQRGQTLAVHETTTRISLDIILKTIFGLESPERVEQARSIVDDALAGFSPALLFTRSFQTPLFPPYRRYMAAYARFTALADELIEARRRAEGSGDDILAMLVAARYDDGSAMTNAQIRGHLLTLVVAGHETTAITLAWAVHELLRHPEALARLRAEVDSLGSEPAADELAKLPYLEAVVKETQRLRTIVTDCIRTLRKPLRFMGYEVPAGHAVSVGIGAIHFDPELYPEPHAFRPERFLERKYGPFEHLPFGGGHRRCIGAAFSDYEAKVVLGTLLSQWDLAPADAEPDVPVRRNVTMGPSRGVPVRVLGRRERG